MADVKNTGELLGKKLIGRNGADIGDVEEVYLDRETDRPQFARVSTGLLGRKSTLVPLVGASVDEVRVWVDIDKASLKDAPTIDSAEEMSSEREHEIYRHYGLEHPGSATAREAQSSENEGPDAATTAPTAEPEAQPADEESQRAEEPQEADGDQTQPRLHRYTVTDEVDVKVPIQREEVRVEDPSREPGESRETGEQREPGEQR